MKIIVGIPHLALLVFLNYICEGSCRTEDKSTTLPPKPRPIVPVKVYPTDFLMAPVVNGKWYGGGYKHQPVKAKPSWLHQPKAPGNMCQVYVQMPDGSGLVGSLFPLKVPAVKGIKIVHAAVKVKGGFALIALRSIDPRKIPEKIVHTRVYLVTPQSELLYGIITSKNVHHIGVQKKKS